MNALQSYSFNAGADNNVTISNGNWYTVNWRDNGYNATNAIFMRTSSAPVDINAVSQIGEDIGGGIYEVYSTQNQTVTIRLSASKSVEENIYLR